VHRSRNARYLGPALFVLALVTAGAARAAGPPGEDLDDPKLARRLKTRVALPAAIPEAGPTADPAPQAHRPANRPDADADDAVTLSRRPSAGVTESAPSPEPATFHEARRTPTLGLGYRRFSFVQVGATSAGTTTGIAASEPFNSVSLDYYPISRVIRWGLSTQYGWQDGRFNSGNGDYFIAQSASLGIQNPGAWASPFVEAFAGGGYMRRFQFEHTIPTAYWHFGIDAGASFFLPDHGYVSLALGYLRPVNGFLKEQSFTSVYVDTWSIKLGFGL
jgi:hypothetical protein